MAERSFKYETEQLALQLSNYTVGFVLLQQRDKKEVVVPAGTGTLVTMGSVFGVQTAAHVLENLPDHGEIGLVLYQSDPKRFQKQTIDMQHAEKIIVKEGKFGPDGPDLGFLRLPPKNIGNLKATNVFFNLGMRRDVMLASEYPTQNVLDVVIGVVAERSKDLPSANPNMLIKEVGAVLSGGKVIDERTLKGYDFLDFEVTIDSDFNLPASFEGTSGGALWRCQFEMRDDRPVVVRKILFGLAFYQSTGSGGARIITCHGPKSIYRDLIDKVVERWPEASPPKA